MLHKQSAILVAVTIVRSDFFLLRPNSIRFAGGSWY
uniref:Uncharacterized protein n=1 Tax=Arundo donax TaxID=35708 RepID=A0A0A9B234_ARUDO